MTPDLDAINVAWSLGDRPCPPIGTVVRFRTKESGFFEIYRGGRSEMVGDVLDRSYKKNEPHVWMRVFDGRAWVPLFVIERIVSVPADSPSFNEWERP